MKLLLLLIGILTVFLLHSTQADQASRLGPEERRTLLDDDDDDVFSDNSPSRNYNSNNSQERCARNFEDCSNLKCCNECTRCACDRYGRNCRCSGRNELALFLGLCRG